MQSALRTATTLALVCLAGLANAQTTGPASGLIGSWVLVGADKQASSEAPERVRGARGLLIIDAAGNVFEYFSTAGRDRPESPLADPVQTLDDVGGFWGTWKLGADARRIEFESLAGVSPSVRGLAFSRAFELDGERLVIVSDAEPQAQADMRWTWQKFPTVENLSPAYRQVAGFWQHVLERQVNTETGEVVRSSERAPSVIVYTPAGFVGVHFPPLGREAFGGTTPTPDEAAAALRGYIGYFGTLGVYPGEVTHNLLAGISPSTGSILRRYADIDGDELVVRLQSLGVQPQGDRPRTVTEVVLRRLSDADDMLPR